MYKYVSVTPYKWHNIQLDLAVEINRDTRSQYKSAKWFCWLTGLQDKGTENVLVIFWTLNYVCFFYPRDYAPFLYLYPQNEQMRDSNSAAEWLVLLGTRIGCVKYKILKLPSLCSTSTTWLVTWPNLVKLHNNWFIYCLFVWSNLKHSSLEIFLITFYDIILHITFHKIVLCIICLYVEYKIYLFLFMLSC